MKVLIIDIVEEGLDLAIRILWAGHDVKFYQPPTKYLGVGKGLVTRVLDWRDHMSWADLIVPTGIGKYQEELEWYHQKGYPIFGANKAAADWELDREVGMQIMRQSGIPLLPYTKFEKIDEAIAHVLAAGDDTRFVSKPCGDGDRAMSYVSKSPDDMIYMLEKWKKEDKLKKPFIMQEFAAGIEMAVGGWWGPAGWEGVWEENFEHKKLMCGEKGQNTGEMGCYSSDSEVLTETGWKLWPAVTMEDKLATLVNGNVVFEHPTQVVNFPFKGNMLAWENQSIDIMVTPNHNMYVNKQWDARRGIDNYQFISAEDCTDAQYSLQRTARWEGANEDYFLLTGNHWSTGLGERHTDDISVPFPDLCKILGIYFAEGSTGGGQVSISQSHEAKYIKVKALIDSTIFKEKTTSHSFGFTINCMQLARLTKPFGKSYEKRIPAYIKNASSENILLFLDAFILGDGNVQSNGTRTIYTSNPDLAGDLQELLLKVGRLGVVTKLPWKANPSKIDGREIVQRRDAYIIFERTKKIRSWLDKRDMTFIPYDGTVYCATVSTHILFVRRNGKPVWCGNTAMKYVEHSNLAKETLEKVEGALTGVGFVGNIDLSCIINKDGIWPMEWTMRMGWPAAMIQLSLHKSDPAEWMLDLVNGKRSLHVRGDTAIGVVIGIPDFPYSKLTDKNVEGVPIYGINPGNIADIHFAQVMAGEVPVVKNGTITRETMFVSAGDNILTVVGRGTTVSKAADRAYKLIDELVIPNSPIYRVDIGKRLEKQIPELQKLGFAEDWEY
jgi:phosphoribosylamine-glycine ligase